MRVRSTLTGESPPGRNVIIDERLRIDSVFLQIKFRYFILERGRLLIGKAVLGKLAGNVVLVEKAKHSRIIVSPRYALRVPKKQRCFRKESKNVVVASFYFFIIKIRHGTLRRFIRQKILLLLLCFVVIFKIPKNQGFSLYSADGLDFCMANQ